MFLFIGSYDDQLLRPPLPGSQGGTGRDSGETHCHTIRTRSGLWPRWWYEMDHYSVLIIVQLLVYLSILRLLLSKTKSFVEPTPEEETYSWVPVKIERWLGKQPTWSIFWSIWSNMTKENSYLSWHIPQIRIYDTSQMGFKLVQTIEAQVKILNRLSCPVLPMYAMCFLFSMPCIIKLPPKRMLVGAY